MFQKSSPVKGLEFNHGVACGNAGIGTRYISTGSGRGCFRPENTTAGTPTVEPTQIVFIPDLAMFAFLSACVLVAAVVVANLLMGALG